jgi:DNA-directed RNA polymerase specialized sigma24 family protein
MNMEISQQPQSLNEILSRLANQPEDQDSWRDLSVRVWPYVMVVNFGLFRGIWRLAEDATQEVLRRLIRYSPIERLYRDGKFHEYVRSLCRNVANEQENQLLRHENLGQAEAADSKPSDKQSSDAALKKAVEQMRESDRQLVGYMLEGYTLSEIAAAQGISDAVERLQDLRGRLHNLLSKG